VAHTLDGAYIDDERLVGKTLWRSLKQKTRKKLKEASTEE
jgi:hypothetical protein